MRGRIGPTATWAGSVAAFCLCLTLLGCRAHPSAPPQKPGEADGFAATRTRMVQDQIANRGVKDKRVLEAMATVPRHEFVPEDQRPHAYDDGPLPIGQGQTISQPYIVALMTELLEIKPTDKVLEIGTGSGYQAAILAELTPNVYTIEILPDLARRAEQTLRRLGYNTVKVKIGDGYQGWAEYAPFDAIIVTCAPDAVPKALAEQLGEGGRMVIPLGPEWTDQTLYLLRKHGGELEQRGVIPVRFVPMVHGE